MFGSLGGTFTIPSAAGGPYATGSVKPQTPELPRAPGVAGSSAAAPGLGSPAAGAAAAAPSVAEPALVPGVVGGNAAWDEQARSNGKTSGERSDMYETPKRGPMAP